MWDLCQYQNNMALIDDKGSSITYNELYIDTVKFAQSLCSRSLIVILCRNSLASLIGYISSLNNKIVPMLLDSELDIDSIQKLISLYRPQYLWVPENKVPLFENVEKIKSMYEYSLLKTDYTTSYKLHPELALLLSTSGSTGSPKFVRQSYENIKSNAESIVKYLELNQNERPITTLPMNYTYGLSIINSHLLVGSTILVTNHSIMNKDFWTFFKNNRATSFGGVPYTYEMLNRLKIEKMDLPSLKTMTQAGGKLSLELQKKFTEFAKNRGMNFIVMYGQCEATARMSYLPMKYAETHYGSIGIPIPGGFFSLIDETGNEIVEPYKEGELVYHGKNVTMGYATDGNDLIKGDERRGILKTGDIAKFDYDHYFYIVGRKKRFLKVYGNRINLDELEQIAKKIILDKEVAVSGHDDNIVIYIEGEETPLNDLRKALVQKTGLNTVAFSFIFIKEIPKNSSGKVLYQKLTQ